ncbi:unnamed protein product [Rotaria socialis]|uniref:Homeobox domain-containing protein n=1 Tax=Rotaria socialis TaxID=392032 RepID=A0A821I2V3_9BILA|nr:unnamed protein product [Rotaria socialis]CAF3378067.1 unnamed protein product [Rotaria socialis]CAF3412478.1 unnamed protein product [Rotaria socialis]CAF3751182.1 unnamed protein product [Rotaria socialis]CAF3758458.1 unnamed protein product [Rotaria socialis]
MNCSVYSSSFLSPYRNSHPHQLSSFRIDDILKAPTSISPTFIDPTALWSSFAAQLLAYSPEILSVSTATTTTASPNDISPALISPQKHLHHRHQYHPYLSISRHSPTTKIQHDSTSNLTTSTNKNNYQHTLSPLSIKDKIQHQHIDRNECLSSMIPSSSHHQASPATAAAAYWPYLYSRCNPTAVSTASVSRRKGGQIRFSAEQSLQLEKKFEISQYLSPVERKQIAKTLHLSERQIKTWFQNRRAKHRRSAATVVKKDVDKSCSSPQQTDDEDDDDDDIDIDDNVDEEHATSSNSN